MRSATQHCRCRTGAGDAGSYGRHEDSDRRDSFCGKMSACNNRSSTAFRIRLTSLHTSAPNSECFANDLAWFTAVCRIVRGFRNLRIGSIGARPAAFNTVRYSEKLLERSGISVEPLDSVGGLRPH